MGNRGIAPPFFTFVQDAGECCVNRLLLYPYYSFYRRLSGPQSQSTRCGEEENDE
jgi:hypothetical protein